MRAEDPLLRRRSDLRQPILGAPESGHSFWIFTSSRQHVEQRLGRCQISGIEPLGEPQAMTPGEMRLDDEIGPTRPSASPFWLSTDRLRSNFVAARFPETENRT